MLGKGFSAGAALAYQSGTVVFVQSNEIWDYISRLNISVFCCKHLNRDHTYFDNYAGIKIGESYWKDDYVGPTYNYPKPWAIGAPSLRELSFQAFYGLTWYPGGWHIGLNAEVGIGSPYLVQTGLLFRI